MYNNKLDNNVFIIYKITNKFNNKSYIGFTCHKLEDRWIRHIYAANNNKINFRFHHAIKKYGEEKFLKEILEENILGLELAHNRETYYILKYKTNEKEFGYNSNSGGSGGWVVKEENYNNWIKRVTESVKGIKNPRYNGYSDEELVSLSCESILKRNLNYVPGSGELIKFAKEDNYNVPKHLTKFRFDGKGFFEYYKRISEKLNIPVDIHWYKKTEKFKAQTRLVNQKRKENNKKDNV